MASAAFGLVTLLGIAELGSLASPTTCGTDSRPEAEFCKAESSRMMLAPPPSDCRTMLTDTSCRSTRESAPR